MNSPAHPVLAALVLCGSAAAQPYTGEGCPQIGPLAVLSGLTASSFGQWSVEGISVQNMGPSTKNVVITARQTRTSPPRASAWRFDTTTQARERLPDLDAMTMDGDQEVSMSDDRCHVFVFRNGAGLETVQRATVTSPWGPRAPVTGVTPTAYSAKHCWVQGQFSVMTVEGAQSPNVVIYSFDRNTGVASNPRVLPGPPLGSPTSYVKTAAPIADPTTGELCGIVAVEAHSISLQQRVYVTPGVRGRRPWYPMLDLTQNNILADVCQWQGGTLAGAGIGPFPTSPLPNGIYGLHGVFTFDREFQTPGRIDLTVLSPATEPPVVATLALGALGSRGLPYQGFTGNLALQPSPIVFVPLVTRLGGTWTSTFSVQQVSGSVTVQPVVFAQGSNVLGASGNVVLR